VNCDICHVFHKSLWREQYIYYLLRATSSLAIFHLTVGTWICSLMVHFVQWPWKFFKLQNENKKEKRKKRKIKEKKKKEKLFLAIV